MEKPMPPELFQVPIEDNPLAAIKHPEGDQNDPTVQVKVADDATAEPDALITIAEPPAPQVQAAPVPEVPQENSRERAEREYHEKAQARIRHFADQLREANKSEVKVHTPPPVAPAIAEQTRREMQAGAEAVARHAAAKAARPALVLSARELAAQGSSTPVFRPADYVPDPTKGQGTAAGTSARNL